MGKIQTFSNSCAKNRLVVQLRNASIGGCRPAPKEYLPQVDLQFFSIRLRRILKLEITPKADILWGPACNPRYYYNIFYLSACTVKNRALVVYLPIYFYLFPFSSIISSTSPRNLTSYTEKYGDVLKLRQYTGPGILSHKNGN